MDIRLSCHDGGTWPLRWVSTCCCSHLGCNCSCKIQNHQSSRVKTVVKSFLSVARLEVTLRVIVLMAVKVNLMFAKKHASKAWKCTLFWAKWWLSDCSDSFICPPPPPILPIIRCATIFQTTATWRWSSHEDQGWCQRLVLPASWCWQSVHRTWRVPEIRGGSDDLPSTCWASVIQLEKNRHQDWTQRLHVPWSTNFLDFFFFILFCGLVLERKNTNVLVSCVEQSRRKSMENAIVGVFFFASERRHNAWRYLPFGGGL